MADNKDKQEEIERSKVSPEKTPYSGEQPGRVEQQEKVPERREVLSDSKIVSAKLRREIEMMELDDSTKKEAEKKAQKIEFLGEGQKIEHLLRVAREKGVVFAIQVAKKMNEPYLLDVLHDTLAQEGFYKKIMKPSDDDTDDDKKT